MNDDYSDLYKQSVEDLGSGGYCDLAAAVLREFVVLRLRRTFKILLSLTPSEE